MPDFLQTLKNTVKKTPLWPIMRPRRIHLYGVGAPKTGTTSVARLFSENYRSAHEADVVQTTHLLQKRTNGSIGHQQLIRAIRWLDRRRRLECESAYYLAHFCDVLVEEFPRARFILTVREPRSWLRSIIDQCINNPRAELANSDNMSYWLTLRDLCFAPPPKEYAPQEMALAQYNLHTLDGYLSYWASHNKRVLEAVPNNRLLIIRTCDLSDSVDRIATFAGIPTSTLHSEESHSHETSRKHGLLNEIDESYLRGKIDKHCSGIQRRLQKTQISQI